MVSYDVIGSIAIMKFDKEKIIEKKKVAEKLLKEHKNIKTVVEKLEKVKGRLRTIKTKFLAGIKTKETIYNESGCRFKLNIETCYFSPRLANERIEVAKLIKSGKKVLVLFAGVSPFPIIIAKKSKPSKVVSVELGKECCKYGKENVKLNKVNDIVDIVQGDANRVVPKLKDNFDYVIMPRPQLKDTFLKPVLKIAKKNCLIVYYDFGDTAEEILEKIDSDSRNVKKAVRIINVKKAGDIGPYKFRWRVDLRVLS